MSIIDNICTPNDTFKALATTILLVVEFWLGKTDRVKASSIIELILNLFIKPKGTKMKVAENVEVNLDAGKLVIAVDLGAGLDLISAKLESGELDPVAGTDLDKMVLVKALEYFKTVKV